MYFLKADIRSGLMFISVSIVHTRISSLIFFYHCPDFFYFCHLETHGHYSHLFFFFYEDAFFNMWLIVNMADDGNSFHA